VRVLVTGGTGYVGSHTVVALMEAGHEVLVVDNLSNSESWIIDRIAHIVGRLPAFERVDLLDNARFQHCFKQFMPEAVIHFAALKSVAESVAMPEVYYRNNLLGTLNVLTAMANLGCGNLVFSSSATVYGASSSSPIAESAPLGPVNPYGRTKLMAEEMIRDHALASTGFSALLLRYFNPAGAHPSARIGELPRGLPNNLTPYVLQVAAGLRPYVNVFGTDYPTRDGTGIRDYIHVCDLADAHVAGLNYLAAAPDPVVRAFNVGTGRGYSVLEVIDALSATSGRQIEWVAAARRPGDVAECYADPSLANRELAWRARRGLSEIAADGWRWQTKLASQAKAD